MNVVDEKAPILLLKRSDSWDMDRKFVSECITKINKMTLS